MISGENERRFTPIINIMKELALCGFLEDKVWSATHTDIYFHKQIYNRESLQGQTW